MTRRAALSKLGIPILLLAGIGAGAAVPAQAVSSVKKFNEALSVDGVASGQAASLAAGSTHTLTFTLGNDPKSNQAFGSAQILVPTGFSAGSPQVVNNTPGNFHVAANLAGSGFLLSSTGPTGSGIAPGHSVSVSLQVTAPTSGACNVVWPTAVKQSNDFSGAGNDFVALNTVTTTVGSNHLVFTTQPTDTEFDKTMATVVVTAEDPCNQAVPGFSGQVTLTDSHGSLSGGGTAGGVSGVATFGSITFAHTDWGYDDAFTAKADGYADATSNTFSVEQLVTTCAPNKTCGTPPSGLTNPGAVNTLAGISVGSAPSTDTLKVSVKGDPNASPPPAFVQACSTSQQGALGTTPRFYGSIVSLQINNRQKTVTMTLPKSYVLLQPTPNGTPFWDICLQSDTPFTAKYQAGLVTAGFLPDCPSALPSPVQPCVLSRNKNAGNEIVKFVLPPGDPHAAWG